MDYAESLKNIKSTYTKAMNADSRAAAIVKKAGKTYKDASKYASISGRHLGDALIDELVTLFPDGIVTEADLMALVPGALRNNYPEIARLVRLAQAAANEEAGIGLNPLVAAFDLERAQGLAKELADRSEGLTGFTDKLVSQVENFSRGTVDESQRLNMEAHNGAGLETKVIRIYDGVGLHDGKQPCAWCLERAGEWSYSEAIEHGVFERHPGCECDISIVSSRGTRYQSDWRRNQWAEDNAPAKIEARRTYGL